VSFMLPAVAEQSPNKDPSAGPRPGKYSICSYGVAGSAPLYLGYFILSDGAYKAFLPGDKPAGEGKYQYDASTHKVTWISGPYVGQWGVGDFTVERGGTRDQIRLRSNTLASNDHS